MVIKADHTWIRTAFSEVPMNDFILRFCFIVLNDLCKALHNFFKMIKQEKYFLLRLNLELVGHLKQKTYPRAILTQTLS